MVPTYSSNEEVVDAGGLRGVLEALHSLADRSTLETIAKSNPTNERYHTIQQHPSQNFDWNPDSDVARAKRKVGEYKQNRGFVFGKDLEY